MLMSEVVYYGDPILRKKAKPVAVFDDDLRAFIEEMKETMADYDGLGLAAPQVGRSIQVVTIDATKGEKPPYVIINPEFTFFSKEEVEREEGCLSFPDIHLNITRPSIVSVKAFDENGKAYAIDNADDLLGRALQHEIDHLNGILIIDHISVIQRKLLSGKLKKIAHPESGRPALRSKTMSA
jgi:peptide deformylase